MRIDHLAMWVRDLNGMKEFYIRYFGAVSNKKYRNEKKGLQTFILSFSDSVRLELMQIPGIKSLPDKIEQNYEGYCHISFALGSELEVDKHTAFLKREGFTVIDGPRRTGDGYYESAVLDPEGNRIEITV